MDPIAFSIGGVDVRWYSILILVGVFLAAMLIKFESNRFRINKEFMFNLVFWTLIFGIIGARLYYVLFNLDYYLESPIEILKIWNGGLAIHGGIIVGLLVIIFYTKKYKANTMKILDIAVVALILAQAIGRWGNFFNGEAFGTAVPYDTLINLKVIPQFIIDNMYINGEYHLPMFFFESVICFLGFIIMLFIRRRKYIKVGQITGFYLIWYGFLRFIIEIFRTDSLMLLNIKVAQVVSIIMVIVGLSIIFTQSKKPKLEELYNTAEEDIRF